MDPENSITVNKTYKVVQEINFRRNNMIRLNLCVMYPCKVPTAFVSSDAKN